jgi:hypothetical protein
MQLRVARLCLDCEEIHAEQQCPVCASEAFTFIKRWVPAPERRSKPRTDSSTGAGRLTAMEEKPVGTAQLVKRAMVGLAAASVAGWLWNRTTREPHPGGLLPPPTQPQNDREPALDRRAYLSDERRGSASSASAPRAGKGDAPCQP